MAGAAWARLAAAYDDPDAVVAEALAAGRRPIWTLGCDAPRELLVAAGFQPVRLPAGGSGPTPRADAAMGSKGLGPRGRQLLERMLAPAIPGVPILITRADAEQAQLFAILRELARLGEASPAPCHLLDLLHLPRASSHRYNQQRLTELVAWLESIGGQTPDPTRLTDALAETRARVALHQRLCAAFGLSGTALFKALESGAILPPAEYAGAMEELLSGLADLPPRSGKRLLVAGTKPDDMALYEAIEALGVTIVGLADDGTPPDAATIEALADPALRTPPALRDPAGEGAALAMRAAASRADLVLHLTIGEDEAAPWEAAALRRAMPAALPFLAVRMPTTGTDPAIERIRLFLAGEAPAERPARSDPPRPAPPRPAPSSRSRKSLASLADFGAYQRTWFADVAARAKAGERFAVVNANAPQEILRALDIPFVVNQWWASIVAAKQQSRRYLGLLRAHDFPGDVEPYSAQGLAAAFDDDPDQAPWGGLPRPDFLQAIVSSDATAKIFHAWAGATGAALYLYERTVDPRWNISTNWWEDLPDRWDEALEPARLDLLVAELTDIIARLEAATGRTFSTARFEEVMALVNEQEEYYRRTRDLIARTVPAPIGIVDSMPATMVPQWHRGTIWARDAAKAFYEEVAARVEAGEAAVANERVRLMWVGRGMWSEMGFYQKWEESHGALFVWSMYLALAADGYIRNYDRGRDPMRALAARFLTMGDELRMPSWAAPWHVHEAETHQVDGAVALADADPFVLRALEQAGIPVLDLGVDNFNREGADADAIDASIAAFIEGAAGARAQARRGVR